MDYKSTHLNKRILRLVVNREEIEENVLSIIFV